MSNNPELIVATQVSNDGVTATLVNSYGVKRATRSSAGVVVLELDHHHNVNHQVPNATLLGGAAGEISVTLVDDEHLQVSTFDNDDVPADLGFALTVQRVR